MTKEIRDYLMRKLHVRSGLAENMKIEQLVDGLSGAEVFRMHVSSSRQKLSGLYIVKLVDTRGPWYKKNSNEATKSGRVKIFVYLLSLTNNLRF